MLSAESYLDRELGAKMNRVKLERASREDPRNRGAERSKCFSWRVWICEGVCGYVRKSHFNLGLIHEVHGFPESLFARPIFLRRLNRDMSKQELNLLQFASGAVTKPSARTPQIMRRKFGDSQSFCVLLHNMPYHLRGHFVPPDHPGATDSTEDFALRHAGRCEPFIYHLLNPVRNRHGSDVTALSNQIDNRPVLFATLEVSEGQFGQLCSPQSATEQNGQYRPVSFPFNVRKSDICQSERASFAVSQFPSRIPNFFESFTLRMPAASSGLNNLVSAAS